MAEYNEMEDGVISLAKYIDGTVDGFELSAVSVQATIYNLIQEQILKFEISDGFFVNSQDLRPRLAIIEKKIMAVLGGKEYKTSVKDFLFNFDNIQERTLDLHKTFSNVDIKTSEFTPAKQIIYDRAVDGLINSGAIATEYVRPVKQLIANNILQGSSISKTVTALENWDKGNLSSGRLTNGTPTPNFTRYATQIARDTAFGVNRSTNEIIKEKFGFSRFIYAGTIVKDSRPLCRHLVGLNRPIELSEMPPLISAYPQGLYPNTTKVNFVNNCGGYNCLHICHPMI